LGSSRADADDTRFTRHAAVVDSDVVAAGGEISAGGSTQGGVVAAVTLKRAFPPIAVLFILMLFVARAKPPVATLLMPVVLAWSELAPTATLNPPVVLA